MGTSHAFELRSAVAVIVAQRPNGDQEQSRASILRGRIFGRQNWNAVNLRSPLGRAVVGKGQRLHADAAKALQNLTPQVSRAE